MRKPLLIVFSVFIFIGLFCIALGAVIYLKTVTFNDNLGYTDAVITEIYGSNQSVYVDYTIDGEEYNDVYLRFYSSSFYVGKVITIYYYKDFPTDIGLKSSFYFYLFSPGFGLIFCCIGLIGIGILNKKERLKKKLLKEGRKITTEYCRCEINYNLSFNGFNPYRIICAVHNFDTNIREYQSEDIFFDPEPIITKEQIEFFSVYVDENNPDKYYVDISNILKLKNKID